MAKEAVEIFFDVVEVEEAELVLPQADNKRENPINEGKNNFLYLDGIDFSNTGSIDLLCPTKFLEILFGNCKGFLQLLLLGIDPLIFKDRSVFRT